ncbi:MAG: hypothetical protein AAF570_02385, partial [Bacteroidota bacterium]
MLYFSNHKLRKIVQLAALIVVFVSPLFGQTTEQTVYSLTGLSSTRAYKALPTMDGHFMLGGQGYTGSQTRNDAFLMKIDSAGTPVDANFWNHGPGGNWDDYFKDVIQLPDSGYVMGTEGRLVFSSTTGDWEPVITRINPDGSKRWTNRLNGSNSHPSDDLKMTNMATLANGDILVNLHYIWNFSSGAPDNSWMIARLDSNGNMTDERVFRHQNYSDGFPGEIHTLDGRRIFAAGNVQHATFDLQATIVELDQNLTVIWSRTFGVDPGFEEVAGFKVAPDSTLWITGYIRGQDSLFPNKLEPYIARFTDTGTMLWHKVVRQNIGSNERPSGLSLTPDGGAIVMVRSTPYDYLLKVDANGDFEWIQADTDDPLFYDVSFAGNGEMMVAASYANPNFFVLSKHAVNGQSSCFDTTFTRDIIPLSLTYGNQVYTNNFNQITDGYWSSYDRNPTSSTANTLCTGTVCSVLANFGTSADTICVGDSVVLADLSSGADSLTWMEGGVVFSTASNPVFHPAGTGVQTISLVAEKDNCVDSIAKSIFVQSIPTVTANASVNSICNGQSVTLTGAGASTYTWDNGATNGVAIAPTATTTYTVTGTDGNGCANTAQTTVTVNALPTVTANASVNSICNGQSVTLTGAGAS